MITATTVEQAKLTGRKRQVALDRAGAYRREQREGGRAATGAADDTVADAAASADGETRGGREGGEDGSKTLDEAEYPNAGYNGMTEPPEPGDDDDAMAAKRCSAASMPSAKASMITTPHTCTTHHTIRRSNNTWHTPPTKKTMSTCPKLKHKTQRSVGFHCHHTNKADTAPATVWVIQSIRRNVCYERPWESEALSGVYGKVSMRRSLVSTFQL